MISQRHPLLKRACIAAHRAKRRALRHVDGKSYAKTLNVEALPHRIFKHQSLLLRKLGDADMTLQYNKVTNLKLAAERITTVLIKPGETFSLWSLVGKPTTKRGFVDGMLLSNGEVIAGLGGGLCQMANLLHWMFLHSSLTVTERFHHSFDAFPDSGRVLPFGTGATIFYNYIDLQVHNPTDKTFQIKLWVNETHLCGELLCDQELPIRYHVFESDHAFLVDKNTGKNYRTNHIWREIRATKTGAVLKIESLFKNLAPMKYTPPADAEVKELATFVA